MSRALVFAFGAISYTVFFATFLYSIGFVGNLLVPKGIDSPADGPLGQAVLVNAILLLAFAVQHSGMARPGFKRVWTKIVPAPMERSTYVLLSSLALIVLYWQWRPLGGVIWDVENAVGRSVLYAFFLSGWLLILFTTFLIDHFDLFGLRQVWLHLRGKRYARVQFTTPGTYKMVRHPLYVGWIVAFWATPTMTVAHLFFAVVTTLYILVAIRLEERDLVGEHGERYRSYRRQGPRLVPRFSGKKSEPGAESEAAA